MAKQSAKAAENAVKPALHPMPIRSHGAGAKPSESLAVSGAVLRAATFDEASLRRLPSVERQVGAHLYRGVHLWDLLSVTAGLSLDPAVKADALHRYVVATGSDGYRAVFSLAELDPGFGAQPILIAYEMDGAPLGGSDFARLVVPNDQKAGRWVARLIRLEVMSAP
jgi:hypothetical protein